MSNSLSISSLEKEKKNRESHTCFNSSWRIVGVLPNSEYSHVTFVYSYNICNNYREVNL